MHIDDDHLYHGAALIQIAEHPNFTAINSLTRRGQAVSSAYKINNRTAVFLKYATKPLGRYKEYQFTFKATHLAELASIAADNDNTFVVMVCVKDRLTCCITYEELAEIVRTRREAKGAVEDQYAILVTAPKGKALRVYVSHPGKRNTVLGPEKKVPRNSFPGIIFE